MNREMIVPYMDKCLGECNLQELEMIQRLNYYLPLGLSIEINSPILAARYSHIDDYIQDRKNNYINGIRAEYEKIVDKCFYNGKTHVILKVLALPDKDDEHYIYENFIYEAFEKHRDDMWHVPNNNWLQEISVDYKHTKKYAEISKFANMNNYGENMFKLSRDGLLYIGTGDNIDIYEPSEEEVFQTIRRNALANYTKEMEDEK